MTEWLVARLREPSTWRGLVWLATAAGITLAPAVWEAIIAVGMALAGLIGVLTAERRPISCGDSNVPNTTVFTASSQRVGSATSWNANHPEADDRCVVSPGADCCHPAADRVRSTVPTVPNFGVRPPIERPLDDQFSGGWGDR